MDRAKLLDHLSDEFELSKEVLASELLSQICQNSTSSASFSSGISSMPLSASSTDLPGTSPSPGANTVSLIPGKNSQEDLDLEEAISNHLASLKQKMSSSGCYSLSSATTITTTNTVVPNDDNSPKSIDEATSKRLASPKQKIFSGSQTWLRDISKFNKIDDKILERILKRIPLQYLIKARRVCTRWGRLIEKNLLPKRTSVKLFRSIRQLQESVGGI